MLRTTSYDALGNVYLSTSYSAVSDGTVVNQVEDVYNGLGQLTGEYQAVSGSVDTSTTPEVQYAYTEMSGGQNNSRQTSMTYPNGRVIDYVYDSGIDSSISRLSAIVDDATDITLESYAYLGLDTLVAWDHPQTGVDLTYLEQSGDTSANTSGGDQYTGLDQFGRVIDQNWVNTSTSSSDVRYQYGYDQDGNVLYRADLVDAALSELYHSNSSSSGDDAVAYDNLGRLTGFSRGVLSASGNNGTTLDTISSPSSSQSWSYDALGNQIDVTTNGTSVTQGFNSEDQQTSTTSGSAPTYDANGNTLTSGGLSYVYDAWNMIVSVTDTSTSDAVASYSYDALGRRIEESYAGGSTNYLYYNANWQVIEQREGGTSSSDVQYQYVWGASNNLILRDSYSSGTIESADRLYALWDANGDITALTNTSGTVVERYEYSPYGTVTVLTASGSPVSGNTSAYGWQYLFQGGRQDSATGLYIFEHRDYDPTTGVWMERDPIGLNGGNNEYNFTQNNPISFSDTEGEIRDGRFPTWQWGSPLSDVERDRFYEAFALLEVTVDRLLKETESESNFLQTNCKDKSSNEYAVAIKYIRDMRQTLIYMREWLSVDDQWEFGYAGFRGTTGYYYAFMYAGNWGLIDKITIAITYVNSGVDPFKGAVTYFNNWASESNWRQSDTQELMITLFHELSHIAGGTLDPNPLSEDPLNNTLMDAKYFEKIARFEHLWQFGPYVKLRRAACGLSPQKSKPTPQAETR